MTQRLISLYCTSRAPLLRLLAFTPMSMRSFASSRKTARRYRRSRSSWIPLLLKTTSPGLELGSLSRRVKVLRLDATGLTVSLVSTIQVGAALVNFEHTCLFDRCEISLNDASLFLLLCCKRRWWTSITLRYPAEQVLNSGLLLVLLQQCSDSFPI